MILSLSYIRKYINDNNIQNPIDISKPIISLGILKIMKQNNDKTWSITINPISNSIYNKGIYTVTIYFPNDYPNHKPEVRILNKIYHLNISPSNGHISSAFLNKWDKSTSLTELLVGIRLVFEYDQNPLSPCSGEMAREFKTKHEEFLQKVEEFVMKYASPKHEDLQLLFELLNKESIELKEKLKILEEENILMKQKLNCNQFSMKILELFQEIKELKSKLSFDLEKNEKLMTVIFTTFDNKLHYAVICKNTHIFNIIENMLYKKYPEYLESDNYFTANEKKIHKYKSLEENEIKNSDIIILNKLNI